ncbi:NADH dehydrogenase I subunit 2 [Vigna unguiculata]|uniref:NADH dehydrogenase I subunit 2 n=1 Tax=Vigna unguiculata TaxID=3917 RepID=A0A4D6LYA6_VIGUN|nr:NADH dehydrogenase I subunit 2 [Vigna unguiculata]
MSSYFIPCSINNTLLRSSTYQSSISAPYSNKYASKLQAGIVGLAAGLAIPPSCLECSLPGEDRNVCNSVLHTGKMKTEFVWILPHVQYLLAVYPEIFIINATSILLIHGVVFSTSKKYDCPPLVSNVGWLGYLVLRALGCGGAKQLERMNVRGAKKAQLPNLMRHQVQTIGNRSMGGCLILLQPQG